MTKKSIVAALVLLTASLWLIGACAHNASARSRDKKESKASRESRDTGPDGIFVPLDNSVNLVNKFKGHQAVIYSTAFGAEGKLLASASHDRSIILWDVINGEKYLDLKGHKSIVYSVAFAPDGKTLASGSHDRTILVWDVEGGRVLKTLSGHASVVSTVAFSRDGKYLASGSHDKTVIIWDVATGEKVRTLKGHTSTVLSVAFSPDGKSIASGSHDKSIILWDAAKGTQVITLKGHRSEVNVVAFSPDGRTLASGGDDKDIFFWSVARGQETKRLTGHNGTVDALSFSRDGRVLASGSSDRTVILWDVSRGDRLRTLKDFSGAVTTVAFSPDGSLLSAAGQDKLVFLYDTVGPYVFKKKEGETDRQYEQRVKALALPYGAAAAFGAYDKRRSGYPVKVAGSEVFVRMPKDIQKKLKKSPEKFSVEGNLVYYNRDKAELVNTFIIEEDTGKKYAFGRHVEGGQEVRVATAPAEEPEEPVRGQEKQPVIEAGTPKLAYLASIEEGNKNNIIEGGESIGIVVKVRNSGNGAAKRVRALLSGEDLILNVLGRSKEIGDIGPGEEKTAEFRSQMPTELEARNAVIEVTVKEGRGFSPTEVRQFSVAMRPAEVQKTTTVVSTLSDIDTLPKGKSGECKDCYAVIIGISKYRAVPEVKYAAKDAETVMRYAEGVVGIPRTNIKFLKDEQATKGDIESSIEEWLPKRVKPTSRVFVYYSGHGTPDMKTNESYLVPYEGEPGSIKKLYPLKSMYDTLNRLQAKQVLVLLDSCFSGSGDRSILPEGARPVALSVENPVLAGEKVAVLTASRGDQISSDYDKVKHGLFTYYLLKGVRGDADGNKDGTVDIGELYLYVSEKVAETAINELDREQNPTLTPAVEHIDAKKFTVSKVK